MDDTNIDKYTEFPAITIGGGTGDYFVQCPTTSCQWAEYAIDTVVNGDGGTGAFVVSGDSKPSALDYTGIAANKMTDGAFLRAVPIRIPATSTQYVNSSYERILNTEKKVYVRIDAASNTSMFITLRFRIRKIDYVQAHMGPTVHPNQQQQMNEARADVIRERLGLEKEIEQGESLNAAPQRAKNMKEMLRGQR